jgi:hypothetical protein
MLDDQTSHIYDMVAMTKQGHLVHSFLVCKLDPKVDTAQTHFCHFLSPKYFHTIHTGRGGDKGHCCSIVPDNEITGTVLLGPCTIRVRIF